MIGTLLTLLLPRLAMADDPGTGTPNEPPSPPATGPSSSPTIHVQLGGAGQLPQQPTRSISVTSDAEGTRVVQLDTTGVLLTGQDAVGGARQQVCTAPCTAQLTPTGTYVIRGYNISESPHFGISDTTKELHIHAGNATVSGLGATSITLGTLSVLAGGAFLVVALAENSTDSNRSTFRNVGWGGLIGGAALIGVGVILGLTNVTHIYDEQGARLAKARSALTLSGVTF